MKIINLNSFEYRGTNQGVLISLFTRKIINVNLLKIKNDDWRNLNNNEYALAQVARVYRVGIPLSITCFFLYTLRCDPETDRVTTIFFPNIATLENVLWLQDETQQKRFNELYKHWSNAFGGEPEALDETISTLKDYLESWEMNRYQNMIPN